jgi:hypothetical protein
MYADAIDFSGVGTCNLCAPAAGHQSTHPKVVITRDKHHPETAACGPIKCLEDGLVLRLQTTAKNPAIVKDVPQHPQCVRLELIQPTHKGGGTAAAKVTAMHI